MLGDRPAAEDVVQEAFCGLYRRWHSLSDTGKALSYGPRRPGPHLVCYGRRTLRGHVAVLAR
jgi:hypothetical protein